VCSNGSAEREIDLLISETPTHGRSFEKIRNQHQPQINADDTDQDLIVNEGFSLNIGFDPRYQR
jgi:hypothetical protein